jgi:hypothetical protein
MDPSLASWYVHATAAALSSVSFHLLVFTKGNATSVIIVYASLTNEWNNQQYLFKGNDID